MNEQAVIEKEPLNKYYQIPISKIPELKFKEIKLSEIDRTKHYIIKEIQTSDGPYDLEIIKSAGTLPVLHKFQDTIWKIEQQIQGPKILPFWQNSTVRYPSLPLILFKLFERYNQLAKEKPIKKIPNEAIITDEDFIELDQNYNDESLLSEVINDGLKQIRKAPELSRGVYAIKQLIKKIKQAQIYINYCSAPPIQTRNRSFNKNVEKWIKKFEDKYCINIARSIVVDVCSLVKYTRLNESFFGITNENLHVCIGTSRQILNRMITEQTGIDRVTLGLQELVNGIAVIIEEEEELFHRSIAEPQLPSVSMRISQDKLLPEGTGKTA